MKTTADFVAFMKATPSIAYTVRGVSGLHMAQLIERLGLAAVVKPKATVVDGFSGTLLREGKVAAAVQQISELKFTGATNIVPLPDEIQVRDDFHGCGAERRHERRRGCKSRRSADLARSRCRLRALRRVAVIQVAPFRACAAKSAHGDDGFLRVECAQSEQPGPNLLAVGVGRESDIDLLEKHRRR